MSLAQLSGLRLIQKFRPYETLAKSNPVLASRHLSLVSTKFSSQVATNKNSFNNITNTGGNQLLSKRLTNPTTNALQIRSASATSHWMKDKLLTSALPVLMPLAFFAESPITDVPMAVLCVLHSHWGFEAILADYARPAVIGKTLPEVLGFLLIMFSAFTLCGLMLLVYQGPGIAKGIKMLWRADSKKAETAAE